MKHRIATLPHCLIASLTVLSLILASCSRSPTALRAALVTDTAGDRYIVRVSGLSSAEVRSLEGVSLDPDDWQAIFSVTVGEGGRSMAGRYVTGDGHVDFVPAFPLDPGRIYLARFDPSRLPAARSEPAMVARLMVRAGQPRAPSTVVAAIHPSADVWPENLLRFYLHFSAPMSRASSVGFVRLVDEKGVEVTDALLEMGVDLWNDDRTRCTVFFDPGRVKRGIRPNRELGRAMYEGRRYAIVVDAAWKDAYGQPLKATYRREFTAGPPVERGISTTDWRIAPPAAGTQDMLEVQFAWALDHGLLQRALGVLGPDGRPVPGEIHVDPGETRWRFVPASRWPAGAYRLVVDPVLEDVSGNQIGRAFEIEAFDPAARAPRPERVTIPFAVKPAS